ncbi:MAG TPA: hypothetical protein VHO24_17000 [Opitutaceae bacterium]|nr:hypothetical protein [Opitutaceae bacterium]
MFVALAGLLTLAAGMMMFSTFMLYDDEGYVLLSLLNFAEHGHLYGGVYTQYGPFPFVFYAVIHALGIPLTHTTGRILTILAWSGTGIACATLAWHGTRSHAARLAVIASVFIYLWIMVSEPTHPGGLIAVITAVLGWWGHRCISQDRTTGWAWLVGAGTAALLLTKINIGVFAGFSAVAWGLLHHENTTVRRWAPPVLTVVAGLLPFALMRPLLGTPWVQTYAIMFACSGMAVMGAAGVGASSRVGWGVLRAGILGALIVAALTLGVIFARGTSAAELIDGVLLGPLRHPASFSLKFPWPAATLPFAIGSLGLFLAARWLRKNGSDRADAIVASLRIAGALGLAITLARFPTISADNLVFGFAAPCLWFFLWPLPEETPALVAARSWVGLLFLGQSLHAFPVPGSQIAWGTFLAIPLAALGAWPAATWLWRNASPRTAAFRSLAPVLVSVFAAVTTARLIQVGNRYLEGRTLELRGSGPLRLPDSATALYRLLAINASTHGDMLFSFPGMFSLNLWSGLPTPTLTNVTHWFSLLDEKRQQAIVESLSAHPRSCVVVQRDHIDFLRKRNLTPTGIINDYLAASYEPAFSVDGFEFWVRKGRHIAPLQTGEVFKRQVGGEGNDRQGNTRLKLNLLLPPGSSIGSVEIAAMNFPNSSPLFLTNANALVDVTPIDLEGAATGPTKFQRLPLALEGPHAVAFYFDRQKRPMDIAGTLIVVRNPAGEEIALVRLLP